MPSSPADRAKPGMSAPSAPSEGTSLPSSIFPWSTEGARTTIADRIAAQTALRIIEQRHEPGTVLTEVELAHDFQASRTPAREAMLQLEAWGLVRLLPKKGAVVTPILTTKRRELIEVRVMFETQAVDALVNSGDDALGDLSRQLTPLLDEQRSAVAQHDLLRFAEADYAFHASIVRAGGNATVTDLLTSLAPQLARLTYDVALSSPASLSTVLEEHATLASRVASGDREGFAAAIRAHVEARHFANDPSDPSESQQ